MKAKPEMYYSCVPSYCRYNVHKSCVKSYYFTQKGTSNKIKQSNLKQIPSSSSNTTTASPLVLFNSTEWMSPPPDFLRDWKCISSSCLVIDFLRPWIKSFRPDMIQIKRWEHSFIQKAWPPIRWIMIRTRDFNSGKKILGDYPLWRDIIMVSTSYQTLEHSNPRNVENETVKRA